MCKWKKKKKEGFKDLRKNDKFVTLKRNSSQNNFILNSDTTHLE